MPRKPVVPQRTPKEELSYLRSIKNAMLNKISSVELIEEVIKNEESLIDDLDDYIRDIYASIAYENRHTVAADKEQIHEYRCEKTIRKALIVNLVRCQKAILRINKG